MNTIMDNLNFNIQEWVNLNSYTDSKGWKGYCRRNKPFTIFRANKIVDYFMHFFRKHTNNIIIVSNIFKVKEYNRNNSNINNYIKYIEKYLIDFGYIETISASIYDNANCLSLGFKKFLITDYDIISMFSLLMMTDEGIDGHCFFVFDELGFIAYPHDDTGFGFIRIKNTKVHYEDLFLKNVSQFSDFTSVVKGNILIPKQN